MLVVRTFIGAVCCLFLVLSCGPVEATSDMTLTVTPSSITFTDTSATTSISTEPLIVSVTTAEGNPAVDVKIYASLDSFWVVNNLVWFPDCLNQTVCSCTTGESGKCSIRISYQHGGGLQYDANVLIYSGTQALTVTISVSAQ